MTDEVVADRARILLHLTNLAGRVKKDKGGKIIHDEIILYLGTLRDDKSCEEAYEIMYLPPEPPFRLNKHGARINENGVRVRTQMDFYRPTHGIGGEFSMNYQVKLSLQGMIDMLSADQSTHVRFQYTAKKAPPKSEMKILIDGDTPRVIK